MLTNNKGVSREIPHILLRNSRKTRRTSNIQQLEKKMQFGKKQITLTNKKNDKATLTIIDYKDDENSFSIRESQSLLQGILEKLNHSQELATMPIEFLHNKICRDILSLQEYHAYLNN
jgi:hypothetical protein